jgi:hypothetical protein
VGCGEVHEIIAGDEEHEKGNDRKDIDMFDAAVIFDIGHQMGMKMDFFDRLQRQMAGEHRISDENFAEHSREYLLR